MIPVSFDADGHRYAVTTGRIVSITQMLVQAGLVDTTWFTEEGKRRGTGVHDVTAAYDLQALDLETCHSEWRAYLLQHVKLTQIVQPEWSHIEVPFVHDQYLYGGRPDRVGRMYRAQAVVEVKSGPPDTVHGIQLALQAYLVAPTLGLPPTTIQRYGWYLTPTRFKLEHYCNPNDFIRARGVIRNVCGV